MGCSKLGGRGFLNKAWHQCLPTLVSEYRIDLLFAATFVILFQRNVKVGPSSPDGTSSTASISRHQDNINITEQAQMEFE